MAFKKLKFWFDEELAERLATKIHAVYSNFPSQTFVSQVKTAVGDLELKDRVEIMADYLKACLPMNYKAAVAILIKILGPENEKGVDMFKEWYWVMPLAKFVEKYGLEDWESSMDAIVEITKRNTGEYAIRPFIEKYPIKTLELMEKWSLDDNFHVRRLACEGIRPRLPWAKKLTIFVENPSPIIPILENLKDDPIKYVQKSVANNINDILKDHREFGMELLNSWIPKATKSRAWIIKHALRNELKKDNPKAHLILSKLSNQL